MELIKGRQGLRQILCYGHGVVAPETVARTVPRAPAIARRQRPSFDLGSDADFLRQNRPSDVLFWCLASTGPRTDGADLCDSACSRY
ncbi:LAQU0S19e00518g1_1 [Lachancea quebecensis]|uniref:LAQU0S19e00518g1_1 n=1 Tax=Lachancea quebecensis TaxID=1654605 RepID=A0A0P1KZ35_9SACH|nr:LAQU0S19e00518g1_1 [Lachancea quebecensis]